MAFVLVVLLAGLTGQTIWAAPEHQGGGTIHYVRAGESLNGIAAQYGVSAEAILRQNGIVNPDMIYVGQPLIIPISSYGGPAGYPNQGYGCANYYTVMMGDTLSGIAWNYGTTPQALMRLNNLYNENFVSGRLAKWPLKYAHSWPGSPAR